MNLKRKYSSSKNAQTIIGVILVALVSMVAFIFKDLINYKIVALLLLVTVSVLAMFFDIVPVLSAALLSALVLNFFFIPPIFTFHIYNTEDLLMFVMYFIIATVNAVLTFKIRKQETAVRDKEEKENTIKLYNTLLNCLSHELKTPIATIIGAVDTFKENYERLSENNKFQLLNEIDTASFRLNRQVENLLNMSRLESGTLKPNLGWCDINEIIYSLIESFKVNECEIPFDSNENLPLIKTDIGFITQILNNIIFNAISHIPYKPIIKISIGIENNICEIEITDNGTGFPEQEINNVFQKFYRLPDAKTGGSGLGLSIVKGFVLALNGQVSLRNVLPHGAQFILTIPVETTYLNNLNNE